MAQTTEASEETPEQQAFRLETRAWLSANLNKRAVADSQGSLLSSPSAEDLPEARRVQRLLSEGGLAGIAWPGEFGGRGATIVEEMIFAQEAEPYDLPTEIFVIGLHLVGPTLVVHGTAEQQARWLPPILDGTDVWCQLFSEPEAGSDLAALRMTARQDGSDWIVNGQKVWTSGAQTSNWGIMPARTDPSVPKHRGITYFAVEMDSPGVSIRPLRQMSGHSHFCEVFFDDVRIPGENLIGELNGGWDVTRTTLQSERHLTGASHGAVDFESLLALARSSTADGELTDQVMRQKLAQIYTEGELLRYLSLRTTTALRQGRPPGPESSVAKLAVASLLRSAGDVALELLGPQGLVEPASSEIAGWVDFFLMAPALRIAGGTDEIQRNIIGERVLGLPRTEDPTRSAAFAS